MSIAQAAGARAGWHSLRGHLAAVRSSRGWRLTAWTCRLAARCSLQLLQHQQQYGRGYHSQLSKHVRASLLRRYDRGHLAPAADHKGSQRAMEDTFTLSNVSPQVGKGFNRQAA